MAEMSARLAEIVAALPLAPGLRVLEIGCGPGVARALLQIGSPTATSSRSIGPRRRSGRPRRGARNRSRPAA
ncbi:hypothetical protein [Tsukamurella sp. PLM1]|uniref:hypothetical protein n=1 Tax=Tsukamurella sp. PLM1 TaxID=2929795 RepID=UPI0035304364